MTKKSQNKLKPKKDGVTNPHNYNFKLILKTENFNALQMLQINQIRP